MLRFEHLSGVTAWLSGGFDCGGYMLGESDAAAAWAGWEAAAAAGLGADSDNGDGDGPGWSLPPSELIRSRVRLRACALARLAAILAS